MLAAIAPCMPPRARVLISLALTLLLLYFFLRGVDLRAAWQEARSARPLWLLVCVVGSFLHFILRAARWRVQLTTPDRPVPFKLCLTCTSLGYFISAILPGRVGDLARPVMLGARVGLSRSYTLATVLVERTVLDPLTLLALLGVVLVSGTTGAVASSGPGSPLERIGTLSALLAAAIVVAVMVAAGLLARRERLLAWLRRPAARGPRWRSRLLDSAERFGDGLASLARRRVWAPVLLGSFLTWAAVCLGMWAGMRAFGVELGYGGAILLTVLAALGVALPTPGGVGGFHVAVQFGLETLYDVPGERSVPATLVTHLLMLLPAFTIGGWTAWREGSSVLGAWRHDEREEA